MLHGHTLTPMDPEYTGHRDADKRRQETKEWLRMRERELSLKSADPFAPTTNLPNVRD